MAESLWGHRIVTNHAWTVRIGRWFRVWLHNRFGVHDFLWTYRAGVDAVTDVAAVVLTKREECSVCDKRRGPIYIVEASVS